MVIEALSYGRAVIAAASGGPLEMIKHGETGLLVDPRDTTTLTTHIVRLARDAELRQRMGGAARRDILSRFVYPDVLAPLWEVIGKLAPDATLAPLPNRTTSLC